MEHGGGLEVGHDNWAEFVPSALSVLRDSIIGVNCINPGKQGGQVPEGYL